MLNEKTILAVIPARGGSKGVKLKNIRCIRGKTLISYVGDIVREVGFFDRAIVSTDHPEIAKAAKDVGLDVPFFRPESLSGDFISDFQVLHHAITAIERIDNRIYDVVVMLQPTCPLRKAKHVIDTVFLLDDGNWDAVWTVSPTDLKYHPFKSLLCSPAGQLYLFDDRGKNIIARQQLEPIYHRNGAAYAFRRCCLLEKKTILPERTSFIVIQELLLSIDTEEDFQTVERYLSRPENVGANN
ncbi:MAG: acylneuraminate cytidylyltransferase family protein [Deltaproteobacteria bacterium]|nr:acylneuraminate cytidylyltransferase family protein [Deltaproteobacteria bacterium]